MKKLLLTLTTCTGLLTAQAQGVYQIPNSDFEGEWVTNELKGGFTGGVTHSEETPASWNSFFNADGEYKDAALSLMSNQAGTVKKTEGHDGNGAAATIVSRKNMMQSISNGNLTTGIVHMGSMTADDPQNYNYSKMDDGNGYCKFAGLPDSIKVWFKFKPKNETDLASMNAILHTDAGYMDPSGVMGEDAEKAARIAKAYTQIAKNEEWSEYSVPFEYNDNGLDATYEGDKYLLLSFSTNMNPGAGSADDSLSIDNIRIIYNSELATLTYDGKDIFVKGQTVFHVDEFYEEGKLAYMANGRAATVETSYNALNAKLTITVKGDDWSEDNLNQHVYTVQFAKEAVYQIPNSDFEGEWVTNELKGGFTGGVTHSEETPASWNSFFNADGQFKDAALSIMANQAGTVKKTEGHDGNGAAATIVSRKNMMQSISNGNLTTGIVHMGSMTADDPQNYNYSKMDDGNGYCKFAGLPDSIKVWFKFKPKNETDLASMNAILHTDAGYMDPSGVMGEDAEKAARIAKAYTQIAKNEEWSEYSVPFEYNDNGLDATYEGDKYLLLSFSTNMNPGAGSADDSLSIDNIRIIYNSELATLTYDGQDILTEGQTAFNVQGKYEEAKLACTSNGRAATIETSYDGDAKMLTITVKGDDWSETNLNQHVYTVTFDESGDGINDIAASASDEPFDVYTLSGVKVRENATNLNGLQRGIYIVNGKKVTVK